MNLQGTATCPQRSVESPSKMAVTLTVVVPTRTRTDPRPSVRGKFVFTADETLYVRGVTYATFRPLVDGSEYPGPEIVELDFTLIAANGLNAVRTYLQQIAAGMIPLTTSVFTVSALIYVAVLMNWQLALVALPISPALYLVSQTYRRRLRSQSRTAKQIESSALSVLQEVLSTSIAENIAYARPGASNGDCHCGGDGTAHARPHCLHYCPPADYMKHCDILIRIEHGHVLSGGTGRSSSPEKTEQYLTHPLTRGG
jgi:hypothetical protein